MVDADLLAAEWNVEAVVRLVDLAGSEAAVVVGTADEQGSPSEVRPQRTALPGTLPWLSCTHPYPYPASSS